MKRIKYTKNIISEQENEESVHDSSNSLKNTGSFLDQEEGSQVIGRFSQKLSENEGNYKFEFQGQFQDLEELDDLQIQTSESRPS